jgi:diacylglycerol kinase (ATP)
LPVQETPFVPAHHQNDTPIPANPQKQRTGLNRLWHATGYSLQGLRAGWQQSAFRQEACLAAVLLPGAFWLGQTWLEVFVLAFTVVFVLVTELLNSAVEATVDRVGLEWHALAKQAKDLGSAAVLLALLLCAGTWGWALWARL